MATSSFVGEFIIERVGMGLLRKYDITIRDGMTISLRPKPRFLDDDTANNFLHVNEDGSVGSTGGPASVGSAFTIKLAMMQDLAGLLGKALVDGDCLLSLAKADSKKDMTMVNALSANWTTEKDLECVRGIVVAADAQGRYQVPKMKSEGWVAVLNDNVDLVKAARTAKAQGATGLIVKCTSNLSLDKVACPEGEQPVLPAVFVDPDAGEALAGRGVILMGCALKGTKLAKALRGNNFSNDGMGGSGKDAAAAFGIVGAALEHLEELANAPQPDGPRPVAQDQLGDDANYKWKVTANCQYLWSAGGGGATAMKVNYGMKAPPSATVRRRINEDGSELQIKDAPRSKRTVFESRSSSRDSVVIVPSENFKQKQLATELTDMLIAEDAIDDLDQLPDNSDFKIEYNFEEVEVAAGETVEDMEEQELIDDEGAAVGRFAVPMKRFWLVAVGMLCSTVLLFGLLFYSMSRSSVSHDEGFEAGDMSVARVVQGARHLDLARPALHFLESHVV
eukprot:NODE_5331_length_1782_cov_5.853776.p1 GENE.NODE_5331_length_1782_cov_5.853776~~NODE_5331_length_1782_cov_5.853776.p1  ORF type:complete len:507 (+),score=128.15 NODE_5331_length_1782_cov_5.853776:256-1776(+)